MRSTAGLLMIMPAVIANAACSLDYDGFHVSPGSGDSGGATTGGGASTGAGMSTGGSGVGAGAAGGLGAAGATGAAGGGGMGGSGGMGGVGGVGGTGCGTRSYPAVVSDCVNPNAPNPDTCQSEAGPGEMIFDTNYADGGGGPRVIYVRFDLDNAFQALDVTSLTLRLTAPGYADADSGSTGEIWRVGLFTRADLFAAGSLPANVSANAIAGELGPLAPSMTVDWALPADLAIPNSSVTLRLAPLDGDVGHYFDQDGGSPPELVVSCQ